MEEEKKETEETTPEVTTTPTENKSSPLVYDGKTNLLSETPGQKYKTLENSLGEISTGDTAKRLGETASQNIQNVNIPKIKTKSMKDIFNDPEFEGKRGSLLGNAIFSTLGQAAGRIGGVDLGSQSRLGQYNDEQWQNYSDMTRDRDRAAFDTNVSNIQAANARDVNQALQTADTVAQKELERYGLLEDLETQKKLLNKLIEDLPEFQSLPAETKVALVGYQQALNGDMTAMDALTNAYGPGIIKMISDFVDLAKKKLGLEEDVPQEPVFTVTGTDYTLDDLATLPPKQVAKLINQLPEEERQTAINKLTPITGRAFKGNYVTDVETELRNLAELKALEEGREQEEEDAHTTFNNSWVTNFKDALTKANDSTNGYKDRANSLRGVIASYESEYSKGGYKDNDKRLDGAREQYGLASKRLEELERAKEAGYEKNKAVKSILDTGTYQDKVKALAGYDPSALVEGARKKEYIPYTDEYKELDKIVRYCHSQGFFSNSAKDKMTMNQAIDNMKKLNPDFDLEKLK